MKTRKGSLVSLRVILLLVVTPLFFAAVLVQVLMNFLKDLLIVQNSAIAMNLISTISGYATALDAIVLVTFIMLLGRILLASFQINMHPIFGVIGLIGLAPLVIVSGAISNVAGVFMELDLVSAAVNDFPASYAFFKNLPSIAVVAGLFILVVMVGIGKVRQ